ncbi:hypothetical protein EJ03DRAFT_15976 [Teratosphaeria nubilosa]|uniref:WSC domain-containing protein n=1 Tax=Teratosphaeria nubilosa TaxID=161662 RepID=A0A6G1KX79_9PEZI|nr:hypothetical protein EJ03DRAFT_15976 [Teratosphaeria nubilosa]
MNAIPLLLALVASVTHAKTYCKKAPWGVRFLAPALTLSCLLTLSSRLQTEGNCWNRHLYGDFDLMEYATRDCNVGCNTTEVHTMWMNWERNVCDFYCNVP